MKTETFLANIKCIATKKCERNEVVKTNFKQKNHHQEDNNPRVQLDPIFKLNFQLIDIDKVFEN